MCPRTNATSPKACTNFVRVDYENLVRLERDGQAVNRDETTPLRLRSVAVDRSRAAVVSDDGDGRAAEPDGDVEPAEVDADERRDEGRDRARRGDGARAAHGDGRGRDRRRRAVGNGGSKGDERRNGEERKLVEHV